MNRNTRKSILFLSGLVVLIVGVVPQAEAGSGGDQWNYFTEVIPHSAVATAKEKLGKSLIMGEEVERVMHVPSALFAAILTLLLGTIAGRRFRNTEEAIRPTPRFGVTAIVEMILQAVYNLASQMMEDKWVKRTFPILATLTLFIGISNIMGSVPGFGPPTDNLNTTAAMGLVVFVATHYLGIRAQGISYFKHFIGPIHHPAAFPLMLLMIVIETIGHFARLVSLSIRLMGNMFADHTVLAIFLGLVPFVLPIPIQILGLLVALVQTFVFLILTVVYFSMALADDH
jgi:F-type H+-transporting ATPase subunit a